MKPISPDERIGISKLFVFSRIEQEFRQFLRGSEFFPNIIENFREICYHKKIFENIGW